MGSSMWVDYKVTPIDTPSETPIMVYFDDLHDGQILQCNPKLKNTVVFQDKSGKMFKGERINNQLVMS